MKAQTTKPVREDIKNHTFDWLAEWLCERGEASYRAGQILRWIHAGRTGSFDEMTNLGLDLRRLLSQNFRIGRLETVRSVLSEDGTKKFLFGLPDSKFIETVLIPEKDHYTLCVSSQAGCAQGCEFCCTAKGGFERNLTVGEILSQVTDAVIEQGDTKRLSNIVFMGMGEPLANYRNVADAISILANDDYGMNFSNRKITLSTAGVVPKLRNLGRDTRVNLAVSLNAATNEVRNRLMPINRKYPLETLVEACKNYALRPRARITFEYILIKGVNDSDDDAKRLAKLLRQLKAKINLIPFNEFDGCGFKRPDESTVLRFQEILKKNNYTVVIRRSKGRDINAACGQLRRHEPLMP